MLEGRLVETDVYDRDAYAQVTRAVPELNELIGRGSRLLPHFEALIADFFAILFKLAVRWRAPEDAPASTLVNRRLLLAVKESPAYFPLKEQTTLNATRSAHAASELARRTLSLVKTGDYLLEEELLGAQRLQAQEQHLASLRAANKDLVFGSTEMAENFQLAVAQGERQVAALSGELRNSLSNLGPQFDMQLAHATGGLAEEVSRLDQNTVEFAQAMGASVPGSAGERLRLSQKLAREQKLRHLAMLVGAFRRQARAARRKRLEKIASEVYRVGRGGDDLGRLLPSELGALRHRLRRGDFLRRLVEKDLLQYDLLGDERRGRGPMVICLDGSGSMAGARELWAKAVTLALADIARKEKRQARVLVFSGPEAELRSFDPLTKRTGGPARVDLNAVVELAECLPQGGTDFEKPLRAALATIRGQMFKGADIVLITDGEAKISDDFAQQVKQAKRRQQMSIFAILVDHGLSRNTVTNDPIMARAARELGKVADRMTTVTQLTSASALAVLKAV